MREIIGAGIFLIIPVIFVVVFSYARQLNELVAYSNLKNLEINSQKYRDVYVLCADIGFLNALFSGEVLETSTDETQRTKLLQIRKLLQLQLVLGLVMLLMVMLAGALKE